MTQKRALTLGGIALVALMIGCTGDDGGTNKNNGGNGGSGEGGDNGASTGGKRTGGSGGSKSGGAGGSKSGGTSAGGSGGTSAGGAGDTSTGGTSAGGTGGGATGGSGGSATGGAGGNAVAGVSWDFEKVVGGWNNGVDHFDGGDAQCAHHRLGIGMPMLSTEQKVSGTMSIKYDIDFTTAKADYLAVCEKFGDDPATADVDEGKPDQILKRTPPNGFAVLVPNTSLLLALAKKGITNRTMPIGTTIKGNMRLSRNAFGVQAFLVGVGIDWQAGSANATADKWVPFEVSFAKENVVPDFGWAEFGLLFGGLPGDFKGTLYLDDIDVILP